MQKGVVLYVFCLIVGVSSTEEPNPNRRGSSLIVGGTNAVKWKYQQFAILYRNGTIHCGGSIINRRSILTAAHCVQGPPEEYTVAVGKYKIRRDQGTEQYFNVSFISIHEDYSALNDDIAIVRLNGRIVFNECVQPAVLAKGSENENLTDCSVIGAGAGKQPTDYPKVLQEIATSFVRHRRCKRLIEKELNLHNSIITTKMLCTFNRNSGVCIADSGGPVGCYAADGTYVQMGIVSFGCPICVHGFSVTTRVSQYENWIKENS